MLTVMAKTFLTKELLLQLSLIFWELFQQLLEFLFPDRLAEHHRPGSGSGSMGLSMALWMKLCLLK